HSLDWHVAYWQCLAPDEIPEVVVLRDGRRVLGILPLTRRVNSLFGRTGTSAPSASVPGAIDLATPYVRGAFAGPVGKDITATIMLVFQNISVFGSEWDSFRLENMNPWTDVGRAETAMEFCRMTPTKTAGDQWHKVDPLQYAAEPNDSTNLFHLHSEGFYQYDDDPCWNEFDQAFALLEPAADSHTIAFWESVHRKAAYHGAYELALLKENGKTVAAAYGFRHEDSCYWVRFSEGHQDYRLLPQLFARGAAHGDKTHFVCIEDEDLSEDFKSATTVTSSRPGRLGRVASRIRQWLLPDANSEKSASSSFE
ncbi:MAG: hypothetical protein ACI9HK_004896, partial [Pirellulaceae bacterium]